MRYYKDDNRPQPVDNDFPLLIGYHPRANKLADLGYPIDADELNILHDPASTETERLYPRVKIPCDVKGYEFMAEKCAKIMLFKGSDFFISRAPMHPKLIILVTCKKQS